MSAVLLWRQVLLARGESLSGLRRLVKQLAALEEGVPRIACVHLRGCCLDFFEHVLPVPNCETVNHERARKDRLCLYAVILVRVPELARELHVVHVAGDYIEISVDGRRELIVSPGLPDLELLTEFCDYRRLAGDDLRAGHRILEKSRDRLR